ncbi:MAG TPA: acyl-CoA thioesterase [Zeimonas sp.]|nr:acyl-CoA thioesterase [Zeimonas sp.]
MSERILVYELEIPIRWGDMDAMGHVNNTVYFRYMEQVRIDWFDSLGFKPEPRGEGPLIVNASCTFIRELRYPGTVICRQYVGEFGRSSVQTYIDMLRADDPDVVYASGAAKVVWVDYERKKSAPLPEAARVAMARPFVRAA